MSTLDRTAHSTELCGYLSTRAPQAHSLSLHGWHRLGLWSNRLTAQALATRDRRTTAVPVHLTSTLRFHLREGVNVAGCRASFAASSTSTAQKMMPAWQATRTQTARSDDV